MFGVVFILACTEVGDRGKNLSETKPSHLDSHMLRQPIMLEGVIYAS